MGKCNKTPVKQVKRQTPLFNASVIATKVADAVTRDFADLTQEYEECSNLYPEGEFIHPLAGAVRQVTELLKKFDPGETKENLELAAYEKFLATNARIGDCNGYPYPSENLRITRDMPFEHKVLIRARALYRHILGPFSLERLFEVCKHSSGSSIGVPFSDTSPERKMLFPLTHTAGCETLMEEYFMWDSKTHIAVQQLNDVFAPSGAQKYEQVIGSRATTVNKKADERRFIAPEPTVNMFLQQGLMVMMYDALKAIGLDVQSLPEQHKFRARLASITRGEATIDLREASNCVGYELTRFLNDPDWFAILDEVSSRHCVVNGTVVRLNMFSTMGNAVTFPLETLVFWTIAQAVQFTVELESHPTKQYYNGLHVPVENYPKCTVFGDDCIVDDRIANIFIKMLEVVGFQTNVEKTFMGSCRFRESCGGDYLAGYDVRPYYLKAPTCNTDSTAYEAWLYIMFNRLNMKYRKYFGDLAYVYGRRLYWLLFKLFRKAKIYPKLVPDDYPDDAGLKLSGDTLRFARAYGVVFGSLWWNRHGQVHFESLEFRYADHRRSNGKLRAALWWKDNLDNAKTLEDDREVNLEKMLIRRNVYSGIRQHGPFPREATEAAAPFVPVRRLGRYVVVKGMTAHWSSILSGVSTIPK